jgi:hypothetical protein
MLRGSCLCGALRFEIRGNHSRIGFCHCSLCRKCSGVNATAAITTDFESLVWISGEDQVRTFERPSGYGSAFCFTCGSPAPETDDNKTMYSIPVGLFDDDPNFLVSDHIYVGSKASWDVIGDNAPQSEHDEGPPRPRDQRI